MSSVNTIVSTLDHDVMRDAFAAMIDAKVAELSGGGLFNRRKARKLARLVDTTEEFEAQYQLAVRRAVERHTKKATDQEFTKADFLDWFQDGGWETLLQFFEGILELISKYFG